MDKQELIDLYKKIENDRASIEKQKIKLNEDILKYRIFSTARVLSHLHLKSFGKTEIKELNLLLTHCCNKLNGNIDGIEINLDGFASKD